MPIPGCFKEYMSGNIAAERDCGRCDVVDSCIVESMSPGGEARKLDTGKPQLSLLHKDFYFMIASRSANGWQENVAYMLVEAGHQENTDEFISCIREAIWYITEKVGVWDTLSHAASAMEYGIRKYERNNWKKGMAWSRLLDAAIRHFTQASLGLEIDEESGLLHIAHGLASLHMLWGCMAMSVGTNDLFAEDAL